MNLLQGVIFDSDGVIIDSAPAIKAAQAEVLGEYGVDVGNLRGHHHSHSVKKLVETIKREHGIHVDPDEFTPKLVKRIIGRLKNAKMDPGLISFIQDLKSHNIPVAVGTCATKDSISQKLAILGLTNTFDAIVTADDVANHKPAPDVYLEAAHRLGATPNLCVVIEDNEVGVEAGRKAGSFVVGFGKYNDDPRAFFGAHTHVEDWAGLSFERLARHLGSIHQGT